jgi:hypothetical protein
MNKVLLASGASALLRNLRMAYAYAFEHGVCLSVQSASPD